MIDFVVRRFKLGSLPKTGLELHNFERKNLHQGGAWRCGSNPYKLLIYEKWFLSSVGSEHLPYKQGVLRSNRRGTTKILFRRYLKVGRSAIKP